MVIIAQTTTTATVRSPASISAGAVTHWVCLQHPTLNAVFMSAVSGSARTAEVCPLVSTAAFN